MGKRDKPDSEQEQRRKQLMEPADAVTDSLTSGASEPSAKRETEGGEPELPADVIDEAERLTRRARDSPSTDEEEMYLRGRRKLLARYGFTARVREEKRAVLVLYPGEWVEDGTVQLERVENVDRGIERPLEGVGEQESWEAIEEHNRALAEGVADGHGPIHGKNVHALADFMGNHYLKEIERASADELTEFCTEYFPRNAWPDEEQQAVVADSIGLAFEQANASVPREFDESMQ